MHKKLQDWIDELDQKKGNQPRFSDHIQLPIERYASQAGPVFHFQLGRVEHVDDLVDLQGLCYGLDQIPWQASSLYKDIFHNPKSLYILAYEERQEAENQLAAFIGAWFLEEGAHITHLCVSPTYQRMGLARFLMDILKEIALQVDIECLTLEVRESNEAAQHLYVRYGFKPIGRIEDYYRCEQEDAIRMLKRIRPEIQEENH